MTRPSTKHDAEVFAQGFTKGRASRIAHLERGAAKRGNKVMERKTSRQAFEAYVESMGLEIPGKTKSGDYAEQDIDSWWYVWQCAARWVKRSTAQNEVSK